MGISDPVLSFDTSREVVNFSQRTIIQNNSMENTKNKTTKRLNDEKDLSLPTTKKFVKKSELPSELWCLVFEFLNFTELLKLRPVCSEWCKLVDQDSWWKNIARKIFGEFSSNTIKNNDSIKWKDSLKHLATAKMDGNYKTESVLCTIANELPPQKFFAFSVSFELKCRGTVKDILDGNCQSVS